MKPTNTTELRPISEVKIVPGRKKGVTGYKFIGRGTGLGNPFAVSETRCAEEAVILFSVWAREGGESIVRRAIADLVYEDTGKTVLRKYPDGVLCIACPCNGAFKHSACHATIVKELIEQEITVATHRIEGLGMV